ncbi:MAG: formate--tetrahydrofolate ligase [Chloroflexi bacterium]|nr:formate--tetrahydrofolate ligase [Chloroflexota bacterium]
MSSFTYVQPRSHTVTQAQTPRTDSLAAAHRSSLEIAQATPLQPIAEIAARLGVQDDELIPYGRHVAKLDAAAILRRLADRPNGRYVAVTAVTPTPLGEGKTLTTVGLSMALSALGKRTVGTIRQPSLGPVFGVKGGAAGGGHSQVLPMESLNLHLTGDNHAVALAHNLLAAAIDAHILHGNALGLDPLSISWPRVVDVNDRALRQIVVGLGGRENGVPRETRFDIAVASEVMAILGLSRDLRELRLRLGAIQVGVSRDGQPVTAEQLQVAGAMAVLLKDALQPNVLQTTEHTPMLVHTGPFANIAHGNSSVLADLLALKLADYVVTESGFGADMGFEKLMHLKGRASGVLPDVAVVVCTVRALKVHSGRFKVATGKPLDPGLEREDPQAVAEGMANLDKHIENVRRFGVPAVVAVNRFTSDFPSEIEAIRAGALRAGALDAQVSDVWAQGSAGGLDLARAVAKVADSGQSAPHFLYDLDASPEEKIRVVAREVYGAADVVFQPRARRQLAQYVEQGLGGLPVCMAKTPLSLSDDAAKKGRPTGFTVTIREVRAYTGAGFLTPVAGEIMTMPGLPTTAAYQQIDLDENGDVVGLF